MDLGLQGKVALVLASTKGLGQAMAISLAKEGVKVAVTGRDQQSLKSTLDQIRSHGGECFGLPWDLYDLSVIDEKVLAVEKALGPIDILVNNTGGPPPTPAANQPAELWQQNFSNLVLSLIKITDRVLPAMRERGWGRIITSTSSGMVAPIPNLAFSNALRASLMGWSKTLSTEVAKDGVTVNIILPGRIATDRLKQLDQAKADREGKSYDDVAKASLSTIPMGRYGEPMEYGDVATFLASRQASYITGTMIRVDGGLVAGY